jgi:DNA helicase-2/ATP-dependent DNA helicase PcrA
MSAAPRPDELPYNDAPREILAALNGAIPTVQQWNAIAQPLEPYGIIAGAGSGKTAVIAARVVYLALAARGRFGDDVRGAVPSQVLCLTFTNKAAEELSRRVRNATAGLSLPEGEEATVLTYHSFASSLLDGYGSWGGIEPGAMLLTDAHQWQLLSAAIGARTFERIEIRNVAVRVPDVRLLASQCADHLVSPQELIVACRRMLQTETDPDLVKTLEQRIELAGVVTDYEARKRKLNAIDYGDQIGLAEGLVRANPSVAQRFRERFEVVLLDEYQDTNIAQARLLEGLIGAGSGYPVTAVGDPDQNIYAWRGASIANILSFTSEFGAKPGGEPGEEKPLYVNFRSGSRILRVADEVISKVDPARRHADKELRPHEDRGEGRVLSFVASDERSEARRIATLLRQLLNERDAVDGEPDWSSVAILCRKKRLFAPISEVLREQGIPAEVVDLNGLLQMPEIVEIVARLRLMADPMDNVALTRILQGPRWRIGYRDLAMLARWAASGNRELSERLNEDGAPGEVAFSLLEAIHDSDALQGLSPDARERIAAFSAEWSELTEAASLPLADLVSAIADITGLMRELAASATAAAAGAQLNILNFIEHVAEFSPVEGDASLATLVDFLEVAATSEDDMSPVQPSHAGAVQIMTIHKAKGLEWPIVFVPGMAENTRSQLSNIFPDTARQADPSTQAKTLPFELRGDRDYLPEFHGDHDTFKDHLLAHALEGERRLCYVALTRARDVLVVSHAYWYTGPQTPYAAGIFFDEVSASDACEVLEAEEMPQENPTIAATAERTQAWPGPARSDDSDDLFPEGWHRAASDIAGGTLDPGARASALGAKGSATFEGRLALDLERAELIRERVRPQPRPPAPDALSVTSLIDWFRCRKLFYWSVIRPLPRRPSNAARLGSEVHRWIELQSRGQTSLLDLEGFEAPDLSLEERALEERGGTEPSKQATLRAAFAGSRFADTTPLFIERPFLLRVDGVVVRGRIDAIFGDADGRWEVVDYKTGRVPEGDAPLLGLQLDLYALACIDIWGKRPDDLTLTFFYLASNEEVSRPATDPEAIRGRVSEALRDMSAGLFDPDPGDHCRWCDFLSFCDAGMARVGDPS